LRSLPLNHFLPLGQTTGTCLTRSTRCLTKTINPKLESSTFWCT
jgi:hypothetical protein